MCDIYSASCEVCGKGWPVHLGDYETGRDEIKVWCGGCWKGDVSNWTRFRCGEGIEMVMGYLTPNAIDNREANHPNTTLCQVVSSGDGSTIDDVLADLVDRLRATPCLTIEWDGVDWWVTGGYPSIDNDTCFVEVRGRTFDEAIRNALMAVEKYDRQSDFKEFVNKNI